MLSLRMGRVCPLAQRCLVELGTQPEHCSRMWDCQPQPHKGSGTERPRTRQHGSSFLNTGEGGRACFLASRPPATCPSCSSWEETWEVTAKCRKGEKKPQIPKTAWHSALPRMGQNRGGGNRWHRTEVPRMPHAGAVGFGSGKQNLVGTAPAARQPPAQPGGDVTLAWTLSETNPRGCRSRCCCLVRRLGAWQAHGRCPALAARVCRCLQLVVQFAQ